MFVCFGRKVLSLREIVLKDRALRLKQFVSSENGGKYLLFEDLIYRTLPKILIIKKVANLKMISKTFKRPTKG